LFNSKSFLISSSTKPSTEGKSKAGFTGVQKRKQEILITSFYDDSFLNAFYAYE